MKKKGFTLIELLAVIVVLAIIALIATPIVMNTIKSAKKGAAERSAENYIRSVELAISTSEINKKSIPDGEYFLDSEGNLIVTSLPDGKLETEMNGNKPKSGILVIKDEQVMTDSTMIIGEYIVYYDETTKRYTAVEIKKYNNGDIVYFNVTTGTKCTSSDYAETQGNIGVKEGCMKFYVFNDNGGVTLNLILDHNTTATVAWNSSEISAISADGPKKVLEQLKTDTDTWQGTITPTNYTMDQTGQTSNANYTIDYSGYKARLITAQEIATITGNTTWNEKLTAKSPWYYLDTNTTSVSSTCQSGNTSGCQYGWLYDRTLTGCTTYGCLNNSDQTTYGYWTASSCANTSSYAWYVSSRALISSDNVGANGAIRGVRPVIAVLRSKFL